MWRRWIAVGELECYIWFVYAENLHFKISRRKVLRRDGTFQMKRKENFVSNKKCVRYLGQCFSVTQCKYFLDECIGANRIFLWRNLCVWLLCINMKWLKVFFPYSVAWTEGRGWDMYIVSAAFVMVYQCMWHWCND